MKLDRRVRTDTAVLVLFDEEPALTHLGDEADWWTGDADLPREEAAGNLVFIETGGDGGFDVSVLEGEAATQDARLVKQASLRAPTGRLYFGAGETMPAGGVGLDRLARYLGHLVVSPGEYSVRVLQFSEDAYGFELMRRPSRHAGSTR